MGYTKGPYSTFTSLPSADVTILHSSRNIDFATRQYTFDEYGNPESMPSTRQRVALAIDFGTGATPKFQTERDLARRKASIIAALKDLVTEGAIRLDANKITVIATAAGEVEEKIEYTDLQTGVTDIVRRWR